MSVLPPLPGTTDPFALLGIARDTDERGVRKAYAALIKVYRPDRAPAEFARVHAAFEYVRTLRTASTRADDREDARARD
ncbi:MAG: J domain-containing protein, partial [Deltaproteobacteria bacterium]|nr:J domain-containing protein [Deltaproteobacteria bacterium]